MSLQPSDQRFRRAVRGFYAWLGSLLFALLAPIAADMLLDVGTQPARILAVILGSIGWLPMAWVVVSIIRLGDEFHRRLYLVSLSIAFGASLVVLTTLDWAVRADFLPRPALSVLWLTFALLWLVSLFVCKHRFERVS
ncbi:MAG TPA: hypothetical protein VJN96_23160 [Vicinamibacterales bacterium]|nr:hypothetical protein [Vicinamibacterales bacterium]